VEVRLAGPPQGDFQFGRVYVRRKAPVAHE
jgi:hypothetical protein